jgi:hypothetical protein
MMRVVRGTACLVAALVLVPAAARGQATLAPFTVNVRVVDSAAAPIAGADVAVVRGIDDVVASGPSNADGRVNLAVKDGSGEFEIVVRKIGYLRADQFFRAAADGEKRDFVITLRRAVQTLATVRVNEAEDVKRKSYFIDADEIAKHGDILIDATDILRRLKPDMICGRDCRPLAAAGARTKAAVRVCPGLAFSQRRVCPADTSPQSLATNVWVNGEWIRTMGYEDVSTCQAGRRGMLSGLLPGSLEVLCEILPEHIAQMTYVDDYDSTIGKIGSNGALFIVLKPGVKYTPGRVSFVSSDSSAKVVAHNDSTRVVVGAAAGDSSVLDSAAKLPAYRQRLLGVFDDATGEPIEGARVIDEATGTYTTTPASGIVGLVFLPEGGSLVRIIRAGFEDVTLSVQIAPSATTPLTLVMKKRISKPEEPPARTRG